MMKKITFIILLCLFHTLIIAQSLSDLDKANGFKDFHLGDLKSKWEMQLSKNEDGLPNSYYYNGSCCQTVFGYPVDFIGLVFDKNEKLSMIYVRIKDNRFSDGMKQILNAVKSAFGDYTGTDFPVDKSGEGTGDMNYQWKTNTILLFVYNKYMGAVAGGWETTLCYTLKSNELLPSNDY